LRYHPVAVQSLACFFTRIGVDLGAPEVPISGVSHHLLAIDVNPIAQKIAVGFDMASHKKLAASLGIWHQCRGPWWPVNNDVGPAEKCGRVPTSGLITVGNAEICGAFVIVITTVYNRFPHTDASNARIKPSTDVVVVAWI
jgi:hypothetical protein